MIINPLTGQIVFGGMIIGSFLIGGVYLNYSQNTTSEYLVSKIQPPTPAASAASSSDAKPKKYKCRIKNNIDEECKIFSIELLEKGRKIKNIKDFVSASAEATEEKIKLDNFFKIKLNTKKLATIHIDQKTIIEIIDTNDKANSVYAKFKIQASNERNNFNAYIQHFVLKIDENISTSGLGKDDVQNLYSCQLKSSNILSLPTQTKSNKCVIERIKQKFNNHKQPISSIDISLIEKFPEKGQIGSEWLSKDLLYIVQTSHKYWRHTLKNEPFILTIKSGNDGPREFKTKIVGTIAAKEYDAPQENSGNISPTATNKLEPKTKIQDIYWI